MARGALQMSLANLVDYLTQEEEDQAVPLSLLADAVAGGARQPISALADQLNLETPIDQTIRGLNDLRRQTGRGMMQLGEDIKGSRSMQPRGAMEEIATIPGHLMANTLQGAGYLTQFGQDDWENVKSIAGAAAEEAMDPKYIEGGWVRPAAEAVQPYVEEPYKIAQEMTMGDVAPGVGILAKLGMAAAPMGKMAKAVTTPGRIDLKDFKHPTKGPNQRSITEVNLRELTQDEAIEAATRGVHLKRDKTGQYIGAPRGVNTPAKLQKLRESYDRQLEDAALGADWYNRARQGVIEVTGDPTAPSNLQPNITKGDLVSDVWGLTSAQRTPEVNMGVATKMINQAAVGQPELTGTMPAINKKVEDTLLGGERQTDDLQKLGVFGTNINPNVPYATTGVNDIWHARAWGFVEMDGSPWESGLSPAQHAFLDGETMLAVARANARQINGKTDWNAATAQAAPWVEGKARGLIEKKATTIIEAAKRAKAKDRSVVVPKWNEAMDTVVNERGYDMNAARAEAAKTYTDFFDKHTAFANYEAVPGDKTGHLPAMLEADDDIKERYTKALTSVDPQGRDLFYDALGIQTRSTQPTQGFYRNEAGQIEANPGRVARPLVGIDPTAPTGRAMDQPSVDIIEGVETLRAVMLGQEGIGYHKPFPRSEGAKGAATGSLRVRLPNRPTPDQLGELNRVLTSDEFADLPYQSAADILVDTGDGVTMINLGEDFGPAVVKPADQKKMVDRLEPHLRRIFGKVGSFEPAYAHGSLVPGLSGAAEAGQGVSVQAVKDALTKGDAPRLIEIFDSPQVQKEAGRIIDVYEAFSQQLGTPQRDDLINWLTLIRDGRGRESLDLIGKIALPAGAGLILTQLFTSETSNEL